MSEPLTERSITDLTGQLAIVTGAAGGIGSAITETLARHGATVVMADLNHQRCKDLAARLDGIGLAVRPEWVDVADRAAVADLVARTLERYGAVHLLVNNGAIDAPSGSAWELTERDWTRVIDVNLTGQWWCTQALLPSMMARKSGRIIFISSVSAKMGDFGTSVAYNAAKAGLLGLTVGLSLQLEEHGILVNAISPGPTGTGRPMTEEEERRHTLSVLPLGLGGPQPIADACLYLAGHGGDWVSGSVFNVSGGMWRG